MRRVTVPVCVAVFLIVAVSVTLVGYDRSPAVLGGAVAALLVAAAGTIVVAIRSPRATGRDLVVLLVVGLAGAALAGLLPTTPGFLIVYLAMGGLGLRLPVRRWPALAAAVALFAAINVAYLLAGAPLVPGLVSADLGAAFVFAVGASIRSAQIAQQQARAAQVRAEDLLAQLRASQDARTEAAALSERARLAREIHDVLAHALSGLVLALDTMELLGSQGDASPDTFERMLEQVRRGQRIARDGLADTKRAIAALRGDALPGPALLDRLVRDTAAAAGVHAELTVAGAERPLPPEIGMTLYRTAQEALTNTAKYAGRGAGVEIRLTYDDGTVELEVQDVRSADAPDTTTGLTFGGYGLTGMRERAELLGGSLAAGPTDTGFGVRLRLPAELTPSVRQPTAGPGP